MALIAVLPAAVLSLSATEQAGAAAKAKPPTASMSSSSTPALTASAERAGQRAVGTGRQATPEQALAAYWTADRMRRATSADEQPGLDNAAAAQKHRADRTAARARDGAARGAKPAAKAPAGKVAPREARSGSRAVARASAKAKASAFQPGYPYYSFTARTAGKVFFTDTSDGLNYVCSATIVNSEGKDSVWTAGHCVHGGQGRNWHANWVFVPSYSNGWAPYGYWSARQLWTTANWANSSDLASDMGVAIMNTNFGWRIVDYLGGQGITWNQSKRIGVTAFGYPAASPFNGETLWACGGTTFPEWEFLWWSAETLGLSCDMTGGSSGGGWLAFFNGSSGYLNGNNSYKYNNDPNTMYAGGLHLWQTTSDVNSSPVGWHSIHTNAANTAPCHDARHSP